MFKGTEDVGYPGGVFNPMGMGKDNMAEMKTKARRSPVILFFAFFVRAGARGTLRSDCGWKVVSLQNEKPPAPPHYPHAAATG